MKTFFTFILLLSFSIGSYAQKTISENQKPKVLTSGIMAMTPSFSIEKTYPNPVKDFVTIELRSEVSGEIQVSLINILGTEIKKWNENFLHQGDQKLKIDLSSFKTGVYILKVSWSDQVRTLLLRKN